MTITIPMQSDALADSVAINIHLEQLGTSFGPSPYAKFDEIVNPLMTQLGARYYRNGWKLPSLNPASLASYNGKHTVLAAQGFKGLFVVGAQGTVYDYSTLATQYAALGKGALWLTGWNEPSTGVADAPAMLTAITALNNAVKTQLPGVTSVSPGFTGGTFYKAWNGAKITPFPIEDVQFGDWHTYQHSAHPENTNVVPLSNYITGMKNTYAPGIPLFVTETGYTSNLNVTVGTLVRGCPENIITRYLPRLFVFYLQSGIVRTWLHQLLDGEPSTSGRQNNAYGLADYNGVPKARFGAVKNLIGLFSDPGPAFTPVPVDVPILSPVPVNSALFQKRDGTNLLCIWQGVSGWSNEAGQKLPITVPPISATVLIPTASAKVVVFNDDGTITGTSVASPVTTVTTKVMFASSTITTSTQSSIPVSVTDSMTVVQF